MFLTSISFSCLLEQLCEVTEGEECSCCCFPVMENRSFGKEVLGCVPSVRHRAGHVGMGAYVETGEVEAG